MSVNESQIYPMKETGFLPINYNQTRVTVKFFSSVSRCLAIELKFIFLSAIVLAVVTTGVE